MFFLFYIVQVWHFARFIFAQCTISWHEKNYLYKNSVECYVAPALCFYIKHSMKASVRHIFWQNPFGSSRHKDRLSLSYFSLFLVMAEAAILDVNLWKIVIASCEVVCDTMLVRIQSEVLENCHFHVFLLLVTAADSHLGLPSHINLKGLHLQIILTECD